MTELFRYELILASGVESNDKSIVHHLGHTFSQLSPYLNQGVQPQISSLSTDAGGGGGTKESCANQFEQQFGEMMFAIWYVITCMLHAHSKPLELAWKGAFGEFGNGNRTSSQFVYSCWLLVPAK